MNEDTELVEYLMSIRSRKSELLNRLKQQGKLAAYILDLNQEMIEKYPDMVEHVYTKEEIDDTLGNGG